MELSSQSKHNEKEEYYSLGDFINVLTPLCGPGAD